MQIVQSYFDVRCIQEACIWVLGIQDICHFTTRDIGYYPFLLPGIWDTVFNIFVTFRHTEYLGKVIMGIFASLLGIFACLLQGIWDTRGIWKVLSMVFYLSNRFTNPIMFGII